MWTEDKQQVLEVAFLSNDPVYQSLKHQTYLSRENKKARGSRKDSDFKLKIKLW